MNSENFEQDAAQQSVEAQASAEQVPGEAVAEASEKTSAEANHVIGVGPWEGEWPSGDHWDEELLREGDRRNVVDKYRYWSMDAIIADRKSVV